MNESLRGGGTICIRIIRGGSFSKLRRFSASWRGMLELLGKEEQCGGGLFLSKTIIGTWLKKRV